MIEIEHKVIDINGSTDNQAKEFMEKFFGFTRALAAAYYTDLVDLQARFVFPSGVASSVEFFNISVKDVPKIRMDISEYCMRTGIKGLDIIIKPITSIISKNESRK